MDVALFANDSYGGCGGIAAEPGCEDGLAHGPESVADGIADAAADAVADAVAEGRMGSVAHSCSRSLEDAADVFVAPCHGRRPAGVRSGMTA